jgi:hypothetical protein
VIGSRATLALTMSITAGCGLEPAPCAAFCCPAWANSSAAGCVARRWSPLGLEGRGSAPQIAVAPDGLVSVAWLETGDRVELRLAAEADGYAVEAPLQMGAASEPQLASQSGGRVVAVWRENAGGTAIRLARRLSDGTWRFPQAALSFPPDAYEPDIATREDEAVVAWNQRTDGHWAVAIARSTGDEDFVGPRHAFDVLSPLIYFSNNPELALHESGAALVTWYQATTDSLMTFVSERRPGSDHFTHPGPEHFLSATGSDVEEPMVAISPAEEAAAAWWQRTSDGRMAVHLAVRAADGAWSNPGGVDDGFSVPSTTVRGVRVAFAGDGDLYVLWQAAFGDDDVGVYLAHRNAAGEWIAPGGAPLRLSAAERRGFDPSLATGRRGAVASWTELEGERTHVVVRKSAIDLAGDEAQRWSAPIPLSQGDGGESMVAVGGEPDRAACVWTEAGAVRAAILE